VGLQVGARRCQESGGHRGVRRTGGKYPDSPLAAEANFHVGESQYEKAAYDDAAKAYSVAKQKSQPGELREKATYKLGWSLFQNKKYEEALAQFSEQATDQPQGPLAADALFMKAECLFRLNKFQDALPVYLATQDVKLASPVSQILALLHGGQCALQAEKWDQAIALLSQIRKNIRIRPICRKPTANSGGPSKTLVKKRRPCKTMRRRPPCPAAKSAHEPAL